MPIPLSRRPAGALPLLAVMVALLGVALPPAAHAQVTNGAVAFSGNNLGSRALYVRNPSGTGLRVLPTGGRSDHPAVSPGGKRIAFTRYGPNGAQLWIAYLDGGALWPLTTGPADSMPEWSPAGDRLIYARGRRGRRDLYSILADGTGRRRLTLSRADDHSPAWSVKDRVAFVRRVGKRNTIYVTGSTRGRTTRLLRTKKPDAYPAWSPTGRTLVFSRGRGGRRDLYVASANGRKVRRLTRVRGDETQPVFSPDGTRIAFVHSRAGRQRLFIVKVRGGAIRRLPSRSLRVRRLTSSRSASRHPSWRPTGLDPVVAAAGDIACDPAHPDFNGGRGTPGLCRQKMTSDLLLRMDLSNVLALGDLQYEDATLPNFMASFHPTWGRMKRLINPVPGNHEYNVPGAEGYFDYFNGVGQQTGPAGDRSQGYYSFDIGTWHVIALNSECEFIGGCGPNDPQMRWLRGDLAANPRTCTVAMWHSPLFTSGRHSYGSDVVPMWELLYANNADLILNGHEHFYERFAKQTPTGIPDPARGIRQITAGMGGKSRFGVSHTEPNTERLDNSTIGVLKLTLREGAYDWELIRAPSGRVADSGTTLCH